MIIPILNKSASSENFVSSPFPETTCTMIFILDPDAKEGEPEGKIGDIQIDYTPHYLNPNAFELSLVAGDGDDDNSKVQIVNGTEIHSVGVMEDVNFRLRCTYVPYGAFSEQAFEVDLESGTVIHPVNSIDLDGTTQYLELQGDTSRLDIGTKTLAYAGWVDGTTGTIQRLFNKGDYTDNGDGQVNILLRDNNVIQISYTLDQIAISQNKYQYIQTVDTAPTSVFHLAVYDSRASVSSLPDIYINGVPMSNVGTWQDDGTGGDRSTDSYSAPFPTAFGRQGNGAGGYIYSKCGWFTGIALDQELTQADAEYLTNAGQIRCWQDVATDNPTLFAKFDMTVDNGTYNNRTELQALTDHTNGWVFTNVNNAPFTDQGLTVECEPSDTQIYPVNSATLNGTNQNLNGGDIFSLGNSNFTIYTKARFNSGTEQVLMGKWGTSKTEWYLTFDNTGGTYDGIRLNLSTNGTGITDRIPSTLSPEVNTWYDIVFSRIGNTLYIYVDGQASGTYDMTGKTVSSNNADFWVGGLDLPLYGDVGVGFTGISTTTGITQADAEYLFNANQNKCWQDVATDNPTLFAKFDDVFDFGTYNGSTETQALTGKKASTVFTNVGSTPFTDQGLTVECST